MEYLPYIMVAVGYSIRLWVVTHNKGFNLLIIKPREIYQSGLYKYIRHPAYLGSLILCGGLFVLIAGSWSVAAPAWLVLLILLTHTARHEELFLLTQFPEYAEYMKTTGMLLPKLRGRK